MDNTLIILNRCVSAKRIGLELIVRNVDARWIVVRTADARTRANRFVNATTAGRARRVRRKCVQNFVHSATIRANASVRLVTSAAIVKSVRSIVELGVHCERNFLKTRVQIIAMDMANAKKTNVSVRTIGSDRNVN